MPYFPPDISNSVTHVTAETLIDAPIETVWNALLDFPTYEKWNPFVRWQAITDANFTPLDPQPEAAEGHHLFMKVRIPPTGLDDSTRGISTSGEIITFADKEHYRIGWKEARYPDFLLRAYRWQQLQEVDVDGRRMIKYWTVETFHGPAAWIIRFFVTESLKISFCAMADALKKYCEEAERPN